MYSFFFPPLPLLPVDTLVSFPDGATAPPRKNTPTRARNGRAATTDVNSYVPRRRAEEGGGQNAWHAPVFAVHIAQSDVCTRKGPRGRRERDRKAAVIPARALSVFREIYRREATLPLSLSFSRVFSGWETNGAPRLVLLQSVTSTRVDVLIHPLLLR